MMRDNIWNYRLCSSNLTFMITRLVVAALPKNKNARNRSSTMRITDNNFFFLCSEKKKTKNNNFSQKKNRSDDCID